jgi:hypothetical protein
VDHRELVAYLSDIMNSQAIISDALQDETRRAFKRSKASLFQEQPTATAEEMDLTQVDESSEDDIATPISRSPGSLDLASDPAQESASSAAPRQEARDPLLRLKPPLEAANRGADGTRDVTSTADIEIVVPAYTEDPVLLRNPSSQAEARVPPEDKHALERRSRASMHEGIIEGAGEDEDFDAATSGDKNRCRRSGDDHCKMTCAR